VLLVAGGRPAAPLSADDDPVGADDAPHAAELHVVTEHAAGLSPT